MAGFIESFLGGTSHLDLLGSLFVTIVRFGDQTIFTEDIIYAQASRVVIVNQGSLSFRVVFSGVHYFFERCYRLAFGHFGGSFVDVLICLGGVAEVVVNICHEKRKFA